MYCGKCGEEIPDGSKFCPKCGALVGGGTQARAAGPVLLQNVRSTGSTFKTLGIILCVFAALGWVLGPVVDFRLIGVIYYWHVDNFISGTVCTLPLAALLAVIGLRSVAESKKGDAARKYTGIADCLLAGAQLFGFAYLTAINILGGYPYYPLGGSVEILILVVLLLIAAAGLYIFIALQKGAAEERRIPLLVAGALLGLFALVSALLSLGHSGISPVAFMLVGSFYTAGLILRAVSLIPRKERAVPVLATLQTRATAFVSGGQTASMPGDAPSMGFAVLSFFFPLVGLILYLVWKDQFPMKARSCGGGALIAVIVSVALGVLSVLLVFMVMLV